MERNQDRTRRQRSSGRRVHNMTVKNTQQLQKGKQAQVHQQQQQQQLPLPPAPIIAASADTKPTLTGRASQSTNTCTSNPFSPPNHSPVAFPAPAPAPALTARRAAADPSFAAKLAHMALPLMPLVRMPSGGAPAQFPTSLLAFWLLTDADCEALAHFYGQRTPGPWSRAYPCPVLRSWSSDAPLEAKRRRIGRFIGLRGCESPVVEAAAAATASAAGPLPASISRGATWRVDGGAGSHPGAHAVAAAAEEEAAAEGGAAREDAMVVDGDAAIEAVLEDDGSVDMMVVQTEEEILDEARRARMIEDEEEVWRRKFQWY